MVKTNQHSSASFRKNVLRILVKYGWNQADLAAEMGVSESYVSQVLCGHKPAGEQAVEKFAHALGVPPATLARKARRRTKK